MKEDSAMNTLVPSKPSQEITRSRRIGFLIYPDCDIVDVCGPCDVFHYSDHYLRRFGRTNEPGYLCNIVAATPGPVRTSCGIELVATHGYCDVRDGVDTLVVAGGMAADQTGCSGDENRFRCRRVHGVPRGSGIYQARIRPVILLHHTKPR